MKLRDYLHFNRITATDFAKQLGVHPNYLRLVANGREPSKDLAIKIEIFTDGEVTVKDLKEN